MQSNQKYRIGESVKVKANIEDPDAYDCDMTDWQGRIIEMEKDMETGEMLLHIQWDSITLKQIPDETIKAIVLEGSAFETMYLGQNDVVRTTERDTQKQTDSTIAEITDAHFWDEEGEQGELIKSVIVGCTTDAECFEAWYKFLDLYLMVPCQVVYVGDTNQTLTQNAKLTLTGLAEIDGLVGVLGKAKHQGKLIAVPLCDLELEDQAFDGWDGLYDYSVWFANR